MNEKVVGLINWIKDWDIMAILYSIISTILIIIFTKWIGLLRWIKRKIMTYIKLKKYLKILTQDCSTLIVIGRRQGFSIKEVFVELDIAPSTLQKSNYEEDEHISSPRTYILVGGPGAGKSTLVKNMIIEKIEQNGNGYPFSLD